QTYKYEERTVQYITSYFEARLHNDISEGFSNSETHELRFFATGEIPEDMALINENWLSDALAKDSRVFLR
ncbi:hypothetical protein A343_0039, partial [Porphyromonas gingivalis JCVI SC001]